MSKRTLSSHPCPTCGHLISGIVVEEDAIKSAPRVPVLIPAKCEKGHQVVLFVDRKFDIRDAEPVMPEVDQKRSAIAKASSWFDEAWEEKEE
jgi:hypothetical protein